jgi:hypothetical protein
MPSTPPGFDAPEAVQARATVQERIRDASFYKALKAERERGLAGPASTEWQKLHSIGWPSPPAITSQTDVDAQSAGRVEEAWSGFFQAVSQSFGHLSEDNKRELKGGLVAKELHDWAQSERSRMVRDSGFRRRLLEGDRDAGKEWSRVTLLLGMKPVPGFRFNSG